MDATIVTEQALKLSTEDKLRLIGEIWDSINDVPKLSEEQLAELERRDLLYQEDPSRAIPWKKARKEIREEVERRLKKRKSTVDAP